MGKTFSIHLHETIKISDFVSVETEVDAIIYRNEFDRYRANYVESKSTQDLIFAFLFLQIYAECFLHQNMRHIVRLEFKPPRDGVFATWMQNTNERRNIRDKLNGFVCQFFSPLPEDVDQDVDSIKGRFGEISRIRNLLAHGHKISAWSNSTGDSGESDARRLLTAEQLNQSITAANELGVAWNDLLGKISPQCIALQRIDDFRFKNLQAGKEKDVDK